MIPLGPVVARARVRAQRSIVWSYLVDPGLRAAWWPELTLDARLGGAVAECWGEGDGDGAITRDAKGEIDVWVDGHAVGFRWKEAGDTVSTAVLLTLRGQGVDTGVTVTETGFDALPMPAERSAASIEGWQSLLADLVSAVDSGAGEATLGDEDADADEADPDASSELDADDDAAVEADIDAEIAEAEADATDSDEAEAEDVDADEAAESDVDSDEANEAETDAEEIEAEVEVEAEADEAEPAEVSADADVDAELEADVEAAEADAVVPLVLPGPQIGGSDQTADEDDSLTGDPDFDALIRGDR